MRFNYELLIVPNWLVMLVLVGLASSFGVPSILQKCHIDDETCLLVQAHKFLESFRNGLPERGMPALEPLALANIEVHNGNERSIKFDLELTNTRLHNFTQMKIATLKGFTKDVGKPMQIEFNSTLPDLWIVANYTVNGKILMLPIISAGDLTMKLTDVRLRTRINALPVERSDGVTYLNIVNYQIATKLHNLRIDMTNLFNGEKELSENILQMLNANWRVLSADVQPKINEALEIKLKAILQSFFEAIPYDELFL